MNSRNTIAALREQNQAQRREIALLKDKCTQLESVIENKGAVEKYIYLGERFWIKAYINTIYTETGLPITLMDIVHALERGGTVMIRPATTEELVPYEEEFKKREGMFHV